MDELKPCPFCGESKVTVTHSPYGGWFARCEWCGAEIGSPESAEEAAENWNRRAAPGNKSLTLDELRKMDKSPVWVGERDKRSHIGEYGLVDTVGERIVFNRSTYITFKAIAGKTAYARKPEGSEKQ